MRCGEFLGGDFINTPLFLWLMLQCEIPLLHLNPSAELAVTY